MDKTALVTVIGALGTIATALSLLLVARMTTRNNRSTSQEDRVNRDLWQTIKDLRDDVRKLEESHQKNDDKIGALTKENIRLDREVIILNARTESMVGLHTLEIARLNDEHRRDLEKMRAEEAARHDADLAAEKTEHLIYITKLNAAHTVELQMLNGQIADLKRQVAALTEELRRTSEESRTLAGGGSRITTTTTTAVSRAEGQPPQPEEED